MRRRSIPRPPVPLRIRSRMRPTFGLLLPVLALATAVPAASRAAAGAGPPSEVRISAGSVRPLGDFRHADLARDGSSIGGSYSVQLGPRFAIGFGGGYTGNDALDRVEEGMSHYHRRFAILSLELQVRLDLVPAASTPYLLARVGSYRWTERVLARSIDGTSAPIFGPLMSDATEFGYRLGGGAQVMGRGGTGVFFEVAWQHVDRGYLADWTYLDVSMGIVMQLADGSR